MVLPYIHMNPPQVYTCSPSWTPLPPPSLYHPFWVVSVHQPQASSIMHRTWTGNSFLIWYYTCFNVILLSHPTLSLSHRVQKTVLYICVSFAVSHAGFYSSVQFSCSVMSDSLQPQESQHARPPCSSLSPEVHSDSRPLCQWCHPAISSWVVPFSSCPQSLPASESFPMSQLFTWGGQSTGVSAIASFLPTRTDLL